MLRFYFVQEGSSLFVSILGSRMGLQKPLLPTAHPAPMGGHHHHHHVTPIHKIGSALFYAATSILLVFVNKSVLTFHHFPSSTMLGVGQMVSGLDILSLCYNK